MAWESGSAPGRYPRVPKGPQALADWQLSLVHQSQGFQQGAPALSEVSAQRLDGCRKDGGAMATPLPGPSAPAPHKGGPEHHDSLLRIVLGPGLCQLDDDALSSLVSHDPFCLSLGGSSLDYNASPQASGSHGAHGVSPHDDAPLQLPLGMSGCLTDEDLALMGPEGFLNSHVEPQQYAASPAAAASSQCLPSGGYAPFVGPTQLVHAPQAPAQSPTGLALPFTLAGPSSLRGQADGGWTALDIFQADSSFGGHNLPRVPALPDLATSYPMVPTSNGGALDAGPSPSVGSVEHESPPTNQPTLAAAGGTGGAAVMPLAGDPDVIYKEKQRAAQKRFRDRQRVSGNFPGVSEALCV